MLSHGGSDIPKNFTNSRSHHVKYLYWNMPYKMYLFHMIKLILQLFNVYVSK